MRAAIAKTSLFQPELHLTGSVDRAGERGRGADGHLGVQAVGHDVGPERGGDAADAFGVEHLDRAELGPLAGGERVQVGAGSRRDAGAGVTVDPVGEDPGLVGPLRRDDADLVFAVGVDLPAELGPAHPYRVGPSGADQAVGEPQVRAAPAAVGQGRQPGEPEHDLPVGGEPGPWARPQPGPPLHPPDLLAGEHGGPDEQQQAPEEGG
jgi:hypothetical protein